MIDSKFQVKLTTWSFEESDLPKWEKIPQIKVDINEWNVYRCNTFEIADWVEEQPAIMRERVSADLGNLTYRFSPEMESWFLMRWS